MKKIIETLAQRAMESAEANMRLSAALNAYLLLLDSGAAAVPSSASTDKVLKSAEKALKALPEKASLPVEDLAPSCSDHAVAPGGRVEDEIEVVDAAEEEDDGEKHVPAGVPDTVTENGKTYALRSADKFSPNDLAYDSTTKKVVVIYRLFRGSEGKAYSVSDRETGEKRKVDTDKLFKLREFAGAAEAPKAEESKDLPGTATILMNGKHVAGPAPTVPAPEPEAEDEPENVQEGEEEAGDESFDLGNADEPEPEVEDEPETQDATESGGEMDINAALSKIAKNERLVYDALCKINPSPANTAKYKAVADATGLANVIVIQAMGRLQDVGLIEINNVGEIESVKGAEKANKGAKVASKAAETLARLSPSKK